jgi:hypothetical protein
MPATFNVIKLLRVFCGPLNSTAAMEEQTPNINVVHSVWRRLKKAKIRDLQPTKDVKGGGGVTDTSKPKGGTGTAGNIGSR